MPDIKNSLTDSFPVYPERTVREFFRWSLDRKYRQNRYYTLRFLQGYVTGARGIDHFFSIRRRILAGTPPTTVMGGTSFVTTAPAATTAP